jgi:hypothetical protein
VAGWLVGFPFTSAPIALFLALDLGTSFAASAARGSIGSVIAQAAFAVAYSRATHLGVPGALAGGTLAFAAAGLLVRAVDATPALLTAVAWTVLAIALRLVPSSARRAAGRIVPPWWDLPGRIVIATVLVLGITSVAATLGPFTSGLISGFPLYATVLGVFAHRTAGPDAARDVMRGLLAGLFGFATFFLVIAGTLESLGTVVSFALATATILVVQGVSFVLLRRAAD